MDDFERKKLWFKKILNPNLLTDTITKSSQNIFSYSFVSEHSKHFFYFLTCIFSVRKFFYLLPWEGWKKANLILIYKFCKKDYDKCIAKIMKETKI